MEFQAFGEIKKLDKSTLTITQKIHGSNAQIVVFEYSSTDGQSHELRLGIKAGSRTRWLTPDEDNFGFATWVEANKKELIDFLGIGQHFGEWAGPGINSGEGLSEKTFVVFDWWRYNHLDGTQRQCPKQVMRVPLLYRGPFDLREIEAAMEDLKANGSQLVEGFMRPEGVVYEFGGTRYKSVFDPEETQWQRPSKIKVPKDPNQVVDFSYLLQPIRLEKLLSRDEAYLRNYPDSLSSIVKDYVEDLIKEEQIKGSPDEIKRIKKNASGQLFQFVKIFVNQKYANVS